MALGSRDAMAQAGPAAPPSAITSPPRDFGPNGPPATDFTDPDVLTVDPSFPNQPNAAIRRLWTGALAAGTLRDHPGDGAEGKSERRQDEAEAAPRRHSCQLRA